MHTSSHVVKFASLRGSHASLASSRTWLAFSAPCGNCDTASFPAATFCSAVHAFHAVYGAARKPRVKIDFLCSSSVHSALTLLKSASFHALLRAASHVSIFAFSA